ncbi:MAG: two-component system response regulator [Thermodesulfovibrio sp.]|nr:two-component system response regulator [Thermodesulfovibrio sp.]
MCMQMKIIRILFVDDNPAFLASALRFLEAETGVEVVGKAMSGTEAIEMSRHLSPDLVLMDIAMPGMDGIQATKIIKQEDPAPRIIILTLYDADEYKITASAAGADGFISKLDFADQIISSSRKLFEDSPLKRSGHG